MKMQGTPTPAEMRRQRPTAKAAPPWRWLLLIATVVVSVGSAEEESKVSEDGTMVVKITREEDADRKQHEMVSFLL